MAKSSCGILIAPEELRCIALRTGRGGLRALGGGVHDLTGEERNTPGGALRALLKRHKLSVDRATLALPKEQVVLHHGMLPTTDPKELEGMARFEAERHIPFNAERHGVGYQVLAERGVEGSEVLLGAADGPAIERAIRAASDGGVQPDGLNVSSACLMNALLHEAPELVRTKTIAIIWIGLQSLELVFVTEGRLLFSRSVPHGLRSLVREWTGAASGLNTDLDRAKLATAAKMIDMMDLDARAGEPVRTAPGGRAAQPGDAGRAWINRIIVELRRSFDFARRENKCPALQSLVLAGEGAILRNLEQYFFVNLNLEIATLNPVARIAGKALEGLPFGGLELTVPFGAAIQTQLPGAYRLDLTPRAHYQRLERRQLMRRLMTTGVIALAALGLAGFAYSELQNEHRQLISDYDAASKKMSEEVSRLREAEKKLSILEGFLDDPTSALAVLDGLYAYPKIPDRLTFTRVAFTKGEQCVVEGHAAAIQDINDFIEHLNASKLFSEVKPVEQTSKAALRGRAEVYVFRIQCKVPPFEPKARKREIPAELPKKKSRTRQGGAETEFSPTGPAADEETRI